MATIALDIDAVPPEKLDAVIAQLEAEKQRRIVTNKLAHYQPYARQGAFHAAGAKWEGPGRAKPNSLPR